MKHYVTLFDSNYLTRGLALHHSLMQYAGDFHLWIICFDDLAYDLLSKQHLDNVTLVSLEQFENSELLRVKKERTLQEYCWTCTPFTAFYVLQQSSNIDSVTYLDADLFFFSSPEPIFEEAGDASIILTEHRYLPEFNHSADNGIYNVQFMTFRQNAEGMRALQWWCDRCIEWCFARCEDNKFGDQKYLDDWLERFEGVHVVRHLGAGLAPWNATQYSLKKKENKVYVNEDPLIFYHFHALRLHKFNIAYLYPNYPTSQDLCRWVYQPYIAKINEAYERVRSQFPVFDSGIVNLPTLSKMSKNEIHHFISSNLRDIKQGRYYWHV